MLSHQRASTIKIKKRNLKMPKRDDETSSSDDKPESVKEEEEEDDYFQQTFNQINNKK